MSHIGCAVGPDGLAASQIQFFHDVNDDVPLPPVASSTSVSGLKLRIPRATKIAGCRRPDRIPKPSQRLIDPDNVAGPLHGTGWDLYRSRSTLSIQDVHGKSDSRFASENGEGMELPPDTDANLSDAQKAKRERIADVQTIFKPGELIDPDTKRKDKEQKGSLAKQAFLKGSVTFLRSHIARHKDHVLAYKSRCAAVGRLIHDGGTTLQSVSNHLPLSVLESEYSIDEWLILIYLFVLPPPVDVANPDLSTRWEVQLFNNYSIPEDLQKTPSPHLLQSHETDGFVAPSDITHPPTMAAVPDM
ncbi:hypothetical protein L210DRAFT_3501531 [Boletus edulis BED1]|uniref:Uncharacterized protein n=1 Tax=Boletus edulis BED1 TaxID=1328754 RepID=A0AAD4C0J8_BOLED|nr:hypothetical protein L210DRAFT_3501531 [Boletus edulis BED1]